MNNNVEFNLIAFSQALAEVAIFKGRVSAGLRQRTFIVNREILEAHIAECNKAGLARTFQGDEGAPKSNIITPEGEKVFGQLKSLAGWKTAKEIVRTPEFMMVASAKALTAELETRLNQPTIETTSAQTPVTMPPRQGQDPSRKVGFNPLAAH